MEEKSWLEFAFVVYPKDSSNLPSRTNEVIRLEQRLLAASKGEDTSLPCFLVDDRAEKRLRKSLIRGKKRRLKGALIQKDYLFAGKWQPLIKWKK